MDPGTRVAHYDVVSLLGKGGMGEVYRARDALLEREVALKILPLDLVPDPTRAARFRREAKLASHLSHPNIATIYEAGKSDGHLFIAMELVRGETLSSQLEAGALPLDVILGVAIQLAEGLSEAHEAGVVHRDLKPANVMVDDRGRVKILDFGVSGTMPNCDFATDGFSSDGCVLGTPHYMSPEQILGQAVDARSDLFSLGVILYELATGVRPFEGPSIPRVFTSIVEDDPPSILSVNPHLGELFAHLVARLLQKDPRARYQTATGVAAELRSLQRPPPGRELQRARRRAVIASGALLVLVAAVALHALLPDPKVESMLESPPKVATEPLLAIVPFAAPPGDDGAASLARSLALNLPEVLDAARLNLLSSRVLGDRAKHRGILAGELDSVTGREIAVEAGATLLLIGALERAEQGFDLYCEILDAGTGLSLVTENVRSVHMGRVHELLGDLAAALLGPVGLGPAVVSETYVLSDSPVALEAWTNGLVSYDRASWEDAIEWFQRAIEADDAFAKAYYYLGRTWWWYESDPTGDRSETHAALQLALEHSERLSATDLERTRLFLELVDIGMWPTHARVDGILERARAIAEASPRDKDALDLWMECAWHTSTDPDETIRAALALTSIDSDYAPAQVHLFDAAVLAHRPGLAQDAAKQVLESSNEMSTRRRAAWVLGREADVLTTLTTRDEVDSFIGAGFWARKHDAAIEIAVQGWAGEVFPNSAAQSLIAMGRFAAARAHYPYEYPKFELGLPRGIGPRATAWGWAYGIVTAARKGALEAAENWFAGWDLDTVPSSDWFLPLWAESEICRARGERELALSLLLEMLEQSSTQPSWAPIAWHAAGRALREDQRWDEAEHVLRRVRWTANAILDVRATYDLALCRMGRGDRQGGLAYLESFLRRWSRPDWCVPEVEEALELYEEMTGMAWRAEPTHERLERFLTLADREPASDPDALTAIQIAMGAGRYAEALAIATSECKGERQRFERKRALAIGRSMALAGLGRFDEARTASGEYELETDPSYWLAAELGVSPRGTAWPHELVRAVQLAQSGDPDSAEMLLQGLVLAGKIDLERAFNRNFHSWVVGEIASSRGDRDRALELFLSTIPPRGTLEQPSAMYAHRAGKALIDAGRHEEAEELLSALEQGQMDWNFSEVPRIRARYELARCRRANGDVEGALSYLTRFLECWSDPDPGFPEIEDALRLYEELAGRAW